LMLVVGSLVGVIVIAMLLPIFSMSIQWEKEDFLY
jgi:type II secretory pathway component PulF